MKIFVVFLLAMNNGNFVLKLGRNLNADHKILYAKQEMVFVYFFLITEVTCFKHYLQEVDG